MKCMATIKVRQNGPYLVEGDDVKLVDWNGNEYQPTRRPFALCRCGASSNRPFCDGTHTKVGFQATEAVNPQAQDKPSNLEIPSLLVKFPAGVQVVEVQDRVEDEKVAPLSLSAPDRIVGEEDDVPPLDRHVDYRRVLRDLIATIEQA